VAARTVVAIANNAVTVRILLTLTIIFLQVRCLKF